MIQTVFRTVDIEYQFKSNDVTNYTIEFDCFILNFSLHGFLCLYFKGVGGPGVGGPGPLDGDSTYFT